MAEFYLGGHWDAENGFQRLEKVSPYPEGFKVAEYCPTCHLPMTKFSDGYRCMNYRAPEHADAMRRTSKRPLRRGEQKEGGKRQGAGRKPKDKDK